MLPPEIIETLTSYGVLGVWVIVGIVREWKQTSKLIEALEKLKDSVVIHDQVMREKVC